MEGKGRGGGAPPANAATPTPTPTPTTATTISTTSTTTKAPEVVIVEQQGPRRRAGSVKRKANNSNTSGISSAPSKRIAREKPHAPLPHLHNGPITRARQSPNKFAAAAAVAASSNSAVAAAAIVPDKPTEPVQPPPSYTVGQATAVTEELNHPNEDSQAASEPVIDAEFEAIRSRDANAHVIPTPAAWFSWTKVHPLEERSLASFFNGKSEKRTSDMYVEIRNLIMKKFHADPKTQIEPKDLTELSVGELDARQEVMEFLDHWGLINFHPFLEDDTATADANADGYDRTASLIEKLYQFEVVQSSPRVGPKADLSTLSIPPRLFPDSAIADEVRPEGPAVEYHCNSCSADCSRKRYHCQKQADFDLCSECYNNGKFDSGMSLADFILMEPAEVPGVSGGSWTDQETLLLLEALELYGENWNEIAEHVATKTKAQCILHFVQMPIEDTFLEGKDNFDASLQGNTDLGSTNKDSSALKDAPETTESKNTESKNMESKNATENDSSSLDNAPETMRSKSATNEEQPLSSPMDTSKLIDASESKVAQEIGANCVMNALKEAFQAVGSLPGPGGSLSFAEAGNPVMALAVYLAGLVEPDVTAASARSSLKATSEDSPGVQLAARHCFLLEDPPDEGKEPPASESADVEIVAGEAQKDEGQKEENHQEENHTSVLDGSDVSKDCTDKKIEDAVPEEKESAVSPHGEEKAKSRAANEPEDVAIQEDVARNTLNESSNSVFPREDPPSTVKESGALTLPAEDIPSSVMESGDVTSLGEVSQCSEEPKAVDMVSDSGPSEEKEPQQTVASDLIVETGANTGEDGAKVVDCKDDKSCNLAETRDDHNMDRIKRAAITALSAAAVKAKLLANQEEDQIRQLATFLIDKQLHKLETKLAFFTEMESVIMRVREQMDRSRQRLYQERAQIIAARLGLPASSSRAIQSSLPTNRIAMNYANSVPKQLPSMNSQKQPIKTIMKTSAPPLSTSSVSSTAAGGSTHPSRQDKLSSIGTNY